MNHIINLTIPAAAYVLLALLGAFGEGLGVVENLPIYYTMLSIPHWAWAGISGYFEASKAATTGGFSGANALLVAIGMFNVFQEKTPESASIWLLYFLAAPMAIALGAYIGSALGRKSTDAA